ncbi:MAG: MATE family efflux transporter [Eubacterium sp.]|nr:MATE family efflux transporter [Eubacterium sp.]
MTKDLTQGDPKKVLWSFCLPLFGSIIFQQLYNIADSFVAGRFIGEGALAAVGNSYEITLIFLAFAFGCNIACSVLASRLFGAKKLGKMKSAISTSMIATGLVCLLLMVVGLVAGDFLLRLIKTPASLLADSKTYLTIYTLGLPFVFFYNLATGIFSALGDSKTPFYFLVFSSLTNIGVDIFFVKNLQLGVAGVAWATFLCQGFSCLLALGLILIRLHKMESEKKFPVFSKNLLKQFALIALPSTLQQSFISVGNIVIQRVINGFGPGVMAGYSAGVKLNNLVITSFTTLANGISNFTSQNLGAGDYARIKAGFKAGLQMILLISLPLIILYQIFPDKLLGFFLENPSTEALHTGMVFLRILSPFYLVISTKLVADGILRGASLMKAFMVATFTDLILRVVLSILLSKTGLGATGIWCSWPVGWSVATVMSLYFYKHIKWETLS